MCLKQLICHRSLVGHSKNFGLKQRLRPLAPGLTPRAVLEKMAALQMVDVHLPTTDGRTIVLSRHTEPNADQALLLHHLKLTLPAQPPPRIAAQETGGSV